MPSSSLPLTKTCLGVHQTIQQDLTAYARRTPNHEVKDKTALIFLVITYIILSRIPLGLTLFVYYFYFHGSGLFLHQIHVNYLFI